MNEHAVDHRSEDPNQSLRYAVYWLLIAMSLASATGRIIAVQTVRADSPLLSANDSSRWSAIRAIVDGNTYAIDQVIEERHPVTNRRTFATIDKVRHHGRDGSEHYYSSKPPLLPTLLASQYWLIKKTTGLSMKDNTFFVVRLMLVLTNVVPLLLYFWVLIQLVERYGTNDWSRIFVMACATFGTFLTTFAITLNNHSVAAVCVMFAIACVLPVWYDGQRRYRYFVCAGLCSAFA